MKTTFGLEGGDDRNKQGQSRSKLFYIHSTTPKAQEYWTVCPLGLRLSRLRLPQTRGLRKCFFCISIVAMSILESIVSCICFKFHDHKVNAASFNLLSFNPPFSIPLSALSLVRHELDRIAPKPVSGGSSRPGLFENRALCRSSGETQSSATTSVTLRRHFSRSSHCQLPLYSCSFSYCLKYILLRPPSYNKLSQTVHYFLFIVRQRQSGLNGPHVIIIN